MGTKVLRHSWDGLQWILSQSQLQNEFKIETLVSRWCYGYFQQSNRCHFRFWNRFHSNQFDPKSGLGRKDFSEVPKEIQFWLGSRQTKSSTGTKWSPENILVYNSTYYDMLEFNSMMKLMQSVSLMLLMLLLWHKFNQKLPFLKIGLLPSSNYRGFPIILFIEISDSLKFRYYTHQLTWVYFALLMLHRAGRSTMGTHKGPFSKKAFIQNFSAITGRLSVTWWNDHDNDRPWWTKRLASEGI